MALELYRDLHDLLSKFGVETIDEDGDAIQTLDARIRILGGKCKELEDCALQVKEMHRILDECFKDHAPDDPYAACRDHSPGYRMAALMEILEAENERLKEEHSDGECFVCGERTSSLVGNPSRWSIWLPFNGGNETKRVYHLGCVVNAIAEHGAARAKDTWKQGEGDPAIFHDAEGRN